jgi:hypothetical protein
LQYHYQHAALAAAYVFCDTPADALDVSPSLFGAMQLHEHMKLV